MIENPRTGEQVEFLSETDDLLVMHTSWTRPGHRAAEHVHPGMEERFEVLEGRAAFRIDGVECEAGPSTPERYGSPTEEAAGGRRGVTSVSPPAFVRGIGRQGDRFRVQNALPGCVTRRSGGLRLRPSR